MKISGWLALAAAGLALAGCDVKQSLTASDRAAREFQDHDTALLCGRFTAEMREAMPCDALERVLRQTDQVIGPPAGKCKWNLAYRIVSLDPFRTVTIYQCPHQKETLKLSITVDVVDGTGYVSGLFGDSPALRQAPVLTRVQLAKTIIEQTNLVGEPADRADWDWPKIFLWTQWQNVKKDDVLSMEWIAPDGDAAGDFSHTVSACSATYYYWSFIKPPNLRLARPAGTWTVRIKINGNEVEAFTFETE